MGQCSYQWFFLISFALAAALILIDYPSFLKTPFLHGIPRLSTAQTSLPLIVAAPSPSPTPFPVPSFSPLDLSPLFLVSKASVAHSTPLRQLLYPSESVLGSQLLLCAVTTDFHL